MAHRGGLAVYVTSHGFGHLNRTVAVLNQLPESVPVTIHCNRNLFDHWRERLRRPAELRPHISDVGAVNPAGDSQATDGAATLELAARVHAEAKTRVDAEADALRAGGFRAVLSDVPPLPLVAARRAGIPGYMLGNFTWAQIYAPHARQQGGEAMRLVADLRAAYRQATAIFRAEPALRFEGIAPEIKVGMVVTAGKDRRAELRRAIGAGAREKVVYFYVGRYGQANLGWDRLEQYQGVHFVGFHPAPASAPPNLHLVAATEWTGADLAASADAIVAKAGYGTVCEAMVARVPIIYPPRTGFSEHRALDRALRAWGGGLPASTREFSDFRLERLLERAFALRPGPAPFPADGARRVARHLVQVCRKRQGTRT